MLQSNNIAVHVRPLGSFAAVHCNLKTAFFGDCIHTHDSLNIQLSCDPPMLQSNNAAVHVHPVGSFAAVHFKQKTAFLLLLDFS